jgi:hypothetical protein
MLPPNLFIQLYTYPILPPMTPREVSWTVIKTFIAAKWQRRQVKDARIQAKAGWQLTYIKEPVTLAHSLEAPLRRRFAQHPAE